MTRDQHLEFCKRCTHREFDPQQGIICKLTRKIAAFEGNCENFKLDETVKSDPSPAAEATPVAAYEIVGNLSTDVKDRLRTQQDWVYAVVGGLSAAIVGGLIWALITVSTNYQIGYMAIGVGLLVGFSVRYFGAGIDYIFGFIGGFFALVGCGLGNLLSQVAFIADAQSMGYFDVLTLLNIPIIISIFEESFSGMDVVFYGIAAYEGYKFAFRGLTDDLIQSVSIGKLKPLPFANLRLPIVIILFVGLSTGFYFVHKGSVGTKAFYYASGAKMSEGTMDYGIEQGSWNFWWENGNPQQSGFFKNGKQDSLWQFFNEDGILYRKGSFRESLQQGEWADYYPNGQISGIGNFEMGRQSGLWKFYYEDGTLSQQGSYKLDQPEGDWEAYFPNKQLSSKGTFSKREPIGLWVIWNENGTKSQEIEYKENNQVRIINLWDLNGKQLIKDGNGIFSSFYPTGEILQTGKVINGDRAGIWKRFNQKGQMLEEGEYKNGLYFINNTWNLDGKAMVVKGEGIFENYYEDGSVQETGKISGGLRNGPWEILSIVSATTLVKSNYTQGKLNGLQESYFETGELNSEGNMKEDKRDGEWKWYYQDGTLETNATYLDGIKQGSQPFYNEAGILTRTEYYNQGELVEVKTGN